MGLRLAVPAALAHDRECCPLGVSPPETPSLSGELMKGLNSL